MRERIPPPEILKIRLLSTIEGAAILVAGGFLFVAGSQTLRLVGKLEAFSLLVACTLCYFAGRVHQRRREARKAG